MRIDKSMFFSRMVMILNIIIIKHPRFSHYIYYYKKKMNNFKFLLGIVQTISAFITSNNIISIDLNTNHVIFSIKTLKQNLNSLFNILLNSIFFLFVAFCIHFVTPYLLYLFSYIYHMIDNNFFSFLTLFSVCCSVLFYILYIDVMFKKNFPLLYNILLFICGIVVFIFILYNLAIFARLLLTIHDYVIKTSEGGSSNSGNTSGPNSNPGGGSGGPTGPGGPNRPRG